MYRYLIYPIDSKQSQPTLTSELPYYVAEGGNEDTYDVIVDLLEGRRWFRGEWAPVDRRGDPGEIMQVGRNAIASIMRERDEATHNAAAAYAMRDELSRNDANTFTRIQGLKDEIDRLKSHIATLERALSDKAWDGMVELGPGYHNAIISIREYERLQEQDEVVARVRRALEIDEYEGRED